MSDYDALFRTIGISEVALIGAVVSTVPHFFSIRSHMIVLTVERVLWGENAVGDTLRVLWIYELEATESGEEDFSRYPVYGGSIMRGEMGGTRAVWFLSPLMQSNPPNGHTVGQPLLLHGSTASELDEAFRACSSVEQESIDREKWEALVGYVRYLR